MKPILKAQQNLHMQTQPLSILKSQLLLGKRNRQCLTLDMVLGLTTFENRWDIPPAEPILARRGELILALRDPWNAATRNWMIGIYTHRIHGTDIFTYIIVDFYGKYNIGIGKSTSPMDPMGYWEVGIRRWIYEHTRAHSFPSSHKEWIQLTNCLDKNTWL